jgi:hypothetical protein
MSDAPDKDDFIEAEVESGVAPLRAMGLSEEVIEGAKTVLRYGLTEDATGRYLEQRARPRVVEKSGPTAQENGDGEESAGPAKVGGSR